MFPKRHKLVLASQDKILWESAVAGGELPASLSLASVREECFG